MAAAVIYNRLGGQSFLCTRLGCKEVDSIIEHKLNQEKVDTSFTSRAREQETPTTIIKDNTEQKDFLFFPGRMSRHIVDVPRAEDIKEKGIGAILIANPINGPSFDPDLILGTISDAKRMGIRIALDTETSDPGSEPLKKIERLLPHLDYLFISQDETEIFFGTRDVMHIFDVLKTKGVSNVIIKDGAHDVWFQSEAGEIDNVTPPNVIVRETSGAGDCFVAGTMYALMSGESLRNAVNFGCTVGAIVVQQGKGCDGVENLSQVKTFLAKEQPSKPNNIVPISLKRSHHL